MNRTYSLLLWMLSATARRSVVSSFVATTRTTTSKSNQFLRIRPSSSFASMSMSSSSSRNDRVVEEEVNSNIVGNLEHVRSKVEAACETAGRPVESVRLVAVSKTKPLSYIKEAYYKCGQKSFGENYAQELEEKAREMGADQDYNGDIAWHFIGGLQSNKAAKLVKNVVPFGKLVVETVNSEKVANKLNNAMVANFGGDDDKDNQLDVFVQVNTSGEDTKSGLGVEESIELCKHIVENCERLKLKGVMTIGAPGDVDCLEQLGACRERVAGALGNDGNELELSMGMSGDYETAIAKGSTNVRVGSTIFGERDYSNKN